MSGRQQNGATPRISRGKSIPNNKNVVKTNQNQIQQKKSINKNSNILDKKRNIKVDYNSSNYFYNDEDYYDDYPYNKMEYYDKPLKERRYNNDTNDSYVTVEHEDGNIQYIPKKYVEIKRASNMYKNDKNIEYYDDEDSENNYNDTENMYYENENENEDDYDQETIEHPSTEKHYQYQNINNYYLTQSNDNNNNSTNNRRVRKNNNQNIISKVVSHQINFTKESKRKNRPTGGSVHNVEKNTTTTNNTYNNNIYYINPIQMKKNSKAKKEENKPRRIRNSNNNNNKNSVHRNIDIIITKRRSNKEKDFFKINNIIDKAEKERYINSAILIQSHFRAFLVKIKLYNNVQLYVCLKGAIMILGKLVTMRKKLFFHLFKDCISHKFYDDIMGSKVAMNAFKEYLINNRNKSKEKPNINSFHKELGDSFNIIIDNSKKENSEKKLKSKLNDMIKENKELKIQLVDNKNYEEKMKNLIDENKKNKNINDIIMKDNQQLAKKLKDMQDYRNTNLFIDNKVSIDLTHEEKLQIEELIKNNEIYLNKLKEIFLLNIIRKRTNYNKNLLKNKFYKYQKVVDKLKNKENEHNIKKEMLTNILFGKIRNKLKSIKQKCFWDIYYSGIISNNENIFNDRLRNKYLTNIINNNQQKIKQVLHKAFFKYYSNVIKFSNEENLKKEEEEEMQNKELSKKILLKKIIKNYHKKKILIFKIFMDKWNLKSKILGMRAAARDKKKKRKLKKKNNRLIYQKHFGIADKKNMNNMGPNLCKSIHEFSYIVSNGSVIKESSSSEPANNFKNNKISTSSDKINKTNNLDKKNVGAIKKTNSVNEIVVQNNISKADSKNDNKENLNGNEESDEDSGDSFGLDNNSD